MFLDLYGYNKILNDLNVCPCLVAWVSVTDIFDECAGNKEDDKEEEQDKDSL